MDTGPYRGDGRETRPVRQRFGCRTMGTFATVFKDAGLPIYINIVISVFVVGIILERAYRLFVAYRVDADVFSRHIVGLLQERQLEKAIQLCNASSAPIARVLKAGIAKLQDGAMAISTSMDEELMRVSPLLEKRIASLWSLANIATLVGLLGTIFGLIRSFAALAAVSPEQKAAFLATGISEAMNNTAIGLGIAILCMMGHLLLAGKSKKMLAELESNSAAFENYLILRHGKTAHK